MSEQTATAVTWGIAVSLAAFLAYKNRILLAALLIAFVASPFDDMLVAYLFTRGR